MSCELPTTSAIRCRGGMRRRAGGRNPWHAVSWALENQSRVTFDLAVSGASFQGPCELASLRTESKKGSTLHIARHSGGGDAMLSTLMDAALARKSVHLQGLKCYYTLRIRGEE